MKVLVSSTGKDLESDVSDVFARCPFFIIADIENKSIKKLEVFENISSKKSGGAGIAAAQVVVEKGAEAIISGNMGPRAKDVLTQFGVKMYKGTGKVGNALELFFEKKLEEI